MEFTQVFLVGRFPQNQETFLQGIKRDPIFCGTARDMDRGASAAVQLSSTVPGAMMGFPLRAMALINESHAATIACSVAMVVAFFIQYVAQGADACPLSPAILQYFPRR